MNIFTQSFFPRFKVVVAQEAWSKSKVILQHFSNLHENAKSDAEKVPIDKEDSVSSLEHTFNKLEIKSDDKNEIPLTSSTGESFKHIKIKPVIKESIVNEHPLLDNSNDIAEDDFESIIKNIGKGVESKWNVSRKDFFEDENLQGFEPILPKAFDECTEDLSDLMPSPRVTVNFASIANKSVMVQELCKLGVNFFKIEMIPENAKYLMGLDYQHDIKPYIQFLNDCNVDPAEFGQIITKNPKIFQEDIENLKTRIRYLRAHAFTKSMIARILTANPFWLMFNTKKIDEKLGFFQKEFKLKGKHVRQLAVKSPQLITHNMTQIKENTFAFREEMGFELQQTTEILLQRPILWKYHREKIVSCFDYVHNNMKIPHEMIVKQPDILMHRRRRVHSRHKYLTEMKKAQYDPTKPNYISLKNLVLGNDIEFCMNIAKCSIETYNLFLKSI